MSQLVQRAEDGHGVGVAALRRAESLPAFIAFSSIFFLLDQLVAFTVWVREHFRDVVETVCHASGVNIQTQLALKPARRKKAAHNALAGAGRALDHQQMAPPHGLEGGDHVGDVSAAHRPVVQHLPGRDRRHDAFHSNLAPGAGRVHTFDGLHVPDRLFALNVVGGDQSDQTRIATGHEEQPDSRMDHVLERLVDGDFSVYSDRSRLQEIGHDVQGEIIQFDRAGGNSRFRQDGIAWNPQAGKCTACIHVVILA